MRAALTNHMQSSADVKHYKINIVIYKLLLARKKNYILNVQTVYNMVKPALSKNTTE